MEMLLLFLLTMLGLGCAAPSTPARIMGGSSTTIEQYPFLSNMQLYSQSVGSWMQACGGSLLTSSTILSSAHCFYLYYPADWNVRLGSTFTSTGGNIHAISEFILHPNYDDETMENDIAIVRLTLPTIFSNSIRNARFAGPYYTLDDDTAVTTVGWGRLSWNGDFAETIREVDISVFNQQTCIERHAFLKGQTNFGYWPVVTDNMMCAGIWQVGACNGDYGGPLLHGNVVVGINSWGYGCGDPWYPAIQTRVANYADWITANAAT